MNASKAGQAAINTAHQVSAFRLQLHDGLTIETPPSLSAVTTYVLLEQEEWFEKEIKFLRNFLRPGMTAIDIGANLGVYSLPMARLVAPGGRVLAYEPGGEARAHLQNSRNANGLDNLEVIGLALSDNAREGHLGFAASSELRSLGGTGTGEPVRITSLDLESALRSWPSVDFVKIDAEGEEERILAGGKNFFAALSPLVMFEVRASDKVNERLRTIFPAIGYRLFRQLAGAPVLVPVDAAQPLDGHELNLFAAKPDLARTLSQRGLLVDSIVDWIPDASQPQQAVSFWQRQKFSSLMKLPNGGLSDDPDYQNALIGYAVWRSGEPPIGIRCAALAFALRSVRAVCARAWTAERASTWARVAWEWGARSESLAALQRLLQLLDCAQLKEPFWPASARFDNVAHDGQPLEWFAAAAAEQYERTFSYSSVFKGASPLLSWLCNQRFASAEMERRRVLMAARAGARPHVPERLCQPAPDHLNADIWRSGVIPGTVL